MMRWLVQSFDAKSGDTTHDDIEDERKRSKKLRDEIRHLICETAIASAEEREPEPRQQLTTHFNSKRRLHRRRQEVYGD